MKRLVFGFLCCLVTFATVKAQTTLWIEDFEGEADGDVSGTATGGTWTTTTPTGGAASFSKQSPLGINLFQVNNTVTEGVWNSNVIDITGLGDVSIELIMVTAFTSATDYLRVYYKLDGGPEILFGEIFGAFFSLNTPASAIVSGTSVQIVVRSNENTPGNIPFTTEPTSMAIDNVQLIDIATLFSAASGNWNAGTTWSTLAVGGASCGCTPNDGTHVIVGSNHTVSITAAADAVNVTLQNTAILRWTADNIDLNISRGGTLTIGSGTSLTLNGNAGAQIDFDYVANNAIVVDGTGSLNIGDIDVNLAATINISGTGTISVGDDFLIGDNATINNNLTGTFTITDELQFEAGSAGAVFTNNQTMTISNDLLFNDDNNNFINNGTLTITSDLEANDNGDDDNVFTNAAGATLTVSGVNPVDGDLDILNSGTINQTGNFTNIDNVDTNFDNLNGGVWNWSYVPGAAVDADLNTVLDLTTVGNTFNYSGAGAQAVLAKTYHNLSISTSGTKTTGGVVDVNGNFLLQNTAIYSTGAAMTLAGNWTNTSTNADPFVQGAQTVTLDGTAAQIITNTGDAQGSEFNNLTINNTFGTSPQITINNSVVIPVTVLGTLTMTDGNVNLNGRTFTIGASAAAPGALSHAGASTNGWMYGGTLVRYVPTTAIAIGAVAGMFPLGGANDFRPFFFGKNNIALSGGSLTVVHTDAATAPNVTPYTDGAVTVVRRHDANWTVTKDALMTTGTFSLRAGGNGFGTIGAIADLRLTKATDATNIGTAAASGGTTTDPRVNRTGLTAAQLNNTFYVSTTNITTSPLPIELLHFNAHLQNDKVVLEWATAQEIDNDFFTIEKSSDLESFDQVSIVKGQGTSHDKKIYSIEDFSPYMGRSYYRLKQTDFDGKFTYSEVKMINYDGPANAFLQAYPNPSNGKSITIEIKGLKEISSVPLTIYNLRGEKVYELSLIADGPGVISKKLDVNSILPPGLYILKAGPTLQLTQKFVVN